MKQVAKKAGHRPREFASAIGIGVTKLYELKNAGLINFVKIGRGTVITDDPQEFLARFGKEAA